MSTPIQAIKFIYKQCNKCVIGGHLFVERRISKALEVEIDNPWEDHGKGWKHPWVVPLGTTSRNG